MALPRLFPTKSDCPICNNKNEYSISGVPSGGFAILVNCRTCGYELGFIPETLLFLFGGMILGAWLALQNIIFIIRAIDPPLSDATIMMLVLSLTLGILTPIAIMAWFVKGIMLKGYRNKRIKKMYVKWEKHRREKPKRVQESARRNAASKAAFNDFLNDFSNSFTSFKCHYCGNKIRFIHRYKRWWCDHCRRYVWYGK
jgi:hypothetical protein